MKFSGPTFQLEIWKKQTSFDMDQESNQPALAFSSKPIIPNFQPWYGEDGKLLPSEYDVGNLFHDREGRIWRIELFFTSNDERPCAELVCASPRVVRISDDEGVLQEYWSSGIVIRDHNLVVATNSGFLDWLVRSSCGIYPAETEDVKHYAILTVDLCIEILMTGAPEIRLLSDGQLRSD